MKLSKILILSLGMALCAAGGVGTALAAITRTPASSGGSGAFDKAIYLYWDSESGSSASITGNDMTTLQTDVAQYRHLVVSPKSSKSVAGTVTVHFALSTAANTQGKTSVMRGLTINVYPISAAPASENAADYVTAIGSTAAACTITCEEGHTTGDAAFTVSAGEAAHETVQHYAIKVVYDGSQILSTEKLSAQLTMTQSFGA